MKKTCQYCGAIIKISKKGNEYCSNICWEKEPYKTQREERRQLLMEITAEYLAEDWGCRD